MDPRSIITPPPDVAVRMMLERLSRRGPIYKLTRFGRRFPLVPCSILWITTRHEPGCIENAMMGTRSPFIAGYVSRAPHDPRRIYLADAAGTREISRTEYAAALDSLDDAARNNRYDPRLSPFDPVRVDAIEIPFL